MCDVKTWHTLVSLLVLILVVVVACLLPPPDVVIVGVDSFKTLDRYCHTPALGCRRRNVENTDGAKCRWTLFLSPDSLSSSINSNPNDKGVVPNKHMANELDQHHSQQLQQQLNRMRI